MATEKRLFEIIECLEHCADNTDCERCSRWLQPCDDHCVDDLLATAAKELRKFMDAVPVVRCKDCKHFFYSFRGNHSCKLHRGLALLREDTFCSYGERRTDE